MQYTPSASRWEVLEVFRAAAEYGAACHVHMRGAGRNEPGGAIESLQEVIAAAAITGAPLHVVHVASTGMRAAPRLLQMIGEAQQRGLDVTTECYPYTAGMTSIQAATFNQGWQELMEIDYGDLEWPLNGERLTADSFEEYRKTGGWVIMHIVPEDVVRACVTSPLTMIATDAFVRDGKGHPRTAGTYSRMLGSYARDQGAMSIMDVLRKSSLMPAQRLEQARPRHEEEGPDRRRLRRRPRHLRPTERHRHGNLPGAHDPAGRHPPRARQRRARRPRRPAPGRDARQARPRPHGVMVGDATEIC